MNIKKALIIVIPILLLFALGRLFLYKNEKEKFIEGLVNQINQEEYTSETIVNIEPKGTNEDETLRTMKLMVKTTKEGKKEEITLNLKGEIKNEKYSDEIPLDLKLSVLIDEEKKEYLFDFTKLMKSWRKYANEEKNKIIYEKNIEGNLERYETEKEIEEKTEMYKAIFGEKKYNGEEKIILKLTEKELKKYLNVDEKTDVNFVNIIENIKYNYFQSVIEDNYQDKIIVTKNGELKAMLEIILDYQPIKGIYSKLITQEKEIGNEIIADTEYKKEKEKIIGSDAEFKIGNAIHDYAYKGKILEKIRTELMLEKNEDTQIKLFVETINSKKANFEIKDKATISYKELGKYQKEEIKIEEKIIVSEEEKEDDIWEIENQENPFDETTIEVTTQDEIMKESEYIDLVPEEFIKSEEEKELEFELIESFVAGDGNTYNNYIYQYVDEIIGHVITINKQTIKNGDAEDVLIYKKETRYADGQIVKQYYEIKWENGVQNKKYEGWKE